MISTKRLLIMVSLTAIVAMSSASISAKPTKKSDQKFMKECNCKNTDAYRKAHDRVVHNEYNKEPKNQSHSMGYSEPEPEVKTWFENLFDLGLVYFLKQKKVEFEFNTLSAQQTVY